MVSTLQPCCCMCWCYLKTASGCTFFVMSQWLKSNFNRFFFFSFFFPVVTPTWSNTICITGHKTPRRSRWWEEPPTGRLSVSGAGFHLILMVCIMLIFTALIKEFFNSQMVFYACARRHTFCKGKKKRRERTSVWVGAHAFLTYVH